MFKQDVRLPQAHSALSHFCEQGYSKQGNVFSSRQSFDTPIKVSETALIDIHHCLETPAKPKTVSVIEHED